MLQKEFFQVQPFNPSPYWEGTVLVNLSGAQKFEDDTIFLPGKYRIEIAPGGYCSNYSASSSIPTGSCGSYINVVETINVPFRVRAYCGGNASVGSVGTNPYTGSFKVNGRTSDTQSHGVDVNHIFGAGGGNCVQRATSPSTIIRSNRGGGNCLGNGSISTYYSSAGPTNITYYYGAGSCLHLMPSSGGTFGTDYIRAYHVAPYAGVCGGAYGGGAAGYIGTSDWGYRGGNSPYGTGGATYYAQGTGPGGGGTKKTGAYGTSVYVAGGARFDGTQWIDVPGDYNNSVCSIIKITFVGSLFS